MKDKKTVLILGAGASKPYGLPLGGELRDIVIKNGLITVLDLHHNEIFTINEYNQFLKALSHSGYSSVDAFLEDRNEWMEIGKAAIARNMIKIESLSWKNLFPPNQPKDHWYEALWSHLKRRSWTEFVKNDIAIISFNYDRTLEHYLVTLLCNNYKISKEKALKGLQSLPLLHVHGDLGDYLDPLTFLSSSSKTHVISSQETISAMNRIQIVHEKDGDTPEFLMAKKLIREAGKVLFIGFGFHHKNLAKLDFKSVNEYNHYLSQISLSVYGTHKGIKVDTWKRICHNYGFSYFATQRGAGSISDFINGLL
jgi:hypothetical protein